MDPNRPENPNKPRVFVDADVPFAGAALLNEHSASHLILRMSKLTLIEAVASTQVITEVECNLSEKLPRALPAFQLLVSRCLGIVADPDSAEIAGYSGLADQQDLSILVAAVRYRCGMLATFNIRHYQPGHPDVMVMKPGDLILRIRYLQTWLSD
jgi:predicted nucleic acid-binding protein